MLAPVIMSIGPDGEWRTNDRRLLARKLKNYLGEPGGCYATSGPPGPGIRLYNGVGVSVAEIPVRDGLAIVHRDSENAVERMLYADERPIYCFSGWEAEPTPREPHDGKNSNK